MQIDLRGSWQLKDDQNEFDLEANLPGNVHLALLNAGIIEDPFYRDLERDYQWISDRDWSYSRELEIEADSPFLNQSCFLSIDGVDTLATLIVNEQEIAHFDNAHRSWDIDLSTSLKSGSNSFRFDFRSPVAWVNKKAASKHLPEWKGPLEIAGRAHLRKASCNFGWDWGPVLTSSGVSGDVKLILSSARNRLNNFYLRQEHLGKDLVVLHFEGLLSELRESEGLDCKLSDPSGKVVFYSHFAKGEDLNVSAAIDHPLLWWCNGLGKANLYSLDLSIRDKDDQLVEETSKKIGVREIKLVRERDQYGESFFFQLNGVRLFAKGANWIPQDAISDRTPISSYESLLQSCVDANMNMIRIWGGGYYEKECFYDFCDEKGLLVWQDFMFACSSYPADDPAFLKNVEVEARQQIKRLRNRACLALWCGNNELEQGLVGEKWTKYHMAWEDYDKLFEQLLRDLVSELDPTADYWPGSPHSPSDRTKFNNPKEGDAHLWDVWHKKQPFEWYRGSEHRFCAEFGFQSFPEPRVVNSFTEPEDRAVDSAVMELHQRSPVGNGLILHYMKDWFKDPKDFDQTLWLSQILQALAIKYAVEHWRRSRPRCMGTLYWQLNDCWPVASWSSIDYYQNWKALHFAAKKFYNPLLLSIVENPEEARFDIHVSNDNMDAFSGSCEWIILDCEATVAEKGSFELDSPALGSRKLAEIGVEDIDASKSDLMIFAKLLDEDGKEISSNFASFRKPKDLPLEDPELEWRFIESDLGDDELGLVLRCQKPSPWVWLSSSDQAIKFSDNFFSMRPGEEKKILLASEGMSLDEIKKSLDFHSLIESYN